MQMSMSKEYYTRGPRKISKGKTTKYFNNSLIGLMRVNKLLNESHTQKACYTVRLSVEYALKCLVSTYNVNIDLERLNVVQLYGYCNHYNNKFEKRISRKILFRIGEITEQGLLDRRIPDKKQATIIYEHATIIIDACHRLLGKR